MNFIKIIKKKKGFLMLISMNLESNEYHFLWGIFVYTGYDYSSEKKNQ